MQLDPSIITVAGTGAAGAGLAYALQGRAVVTEHAPEEGEVRGTVRGSGRSRYETTTWTDVDGRGVTIYAGGDCTCPVGTDCKHSVALFLEAFGSVAPAQPAAPPAPVQRAPAPPPPPAWEQTLARIFGADAPVGTVPLALAFQAGPDGPAVPPRWAPATAPRTALRVRPLRMGKRGTWIQTGANWRDFEHAVPNDVVPEQGRAMRSLAGFLARNDAYYYAAGAGWHSLERFVAVPPWPLLRELRDAGVALVEPARRHGPVRLLDEEAQAVVAVVDEQGGVQLDARLLLPAGVELSGVEPLGVPVVAATGRDADGALTVVGLHRAAPQEWQAVRDAGGVRVPAADRERFERTALPRIARRIGWRSPDGSFAPAPPAPPVLEVLVQVEADVRSPVAHVEMHLRYGRAAGEHAPFSLPDLLSVTRDERAEQALAERALPVLHRLPPLPDGLTSWSPLTLTGRDVATLVTEVVPALAALDDVTVRMSDGVPDFRDLGDPEVRVGLTPGTDWFDLDVEVTVGGVGIPAASLITALAQDQDTLFLADGGFVTLDRPELERLRALLEEARALADPRSGTLRVSRLRISWWEELLALGVVDAQERAWFDALRLAALAPESAPPLPEGLHAELRPYQREGYGWLARLRRAGLGGVLADDMGLGKTLQSLAMILDARLERPGDGPFVVVAPTSVVPNWAAEAARFTPGLKVATVTQMQARRGVPLAEAVAGADVVVTSYSLFRLEYDQYAALAPSGLLLDEAQNAKNHQSKAFACAKQLPAPVKFAVTGTPMENHLGELWAMFAIVAPGLLGAPKQFGEHYRGPIERGTAPGTMDRLRARTAPFLLRRTKEQVATDLPGKQEQQLDVELAPAHRRLYARQLQRERQKVLGLVDDLDRNRIEVLSALTRLRQLAIDASLVGEEGAGVPSSKLDVLLPLVEQAAAEGHRVLVFSQFTRFLDLIQARLVESGIAFVRLDGSTKRRGDVVRSFAEGDQPVFLISLKAGGTGLNLAMADYCVLTDPWWNPAAEAQAVDRAHRIGQQRPVVVYRLIAKDTIEEKVVQLQDRKRALVAGVLGGEGGGAISAADIRSLLED